MIGSKHKIDGKEYVEVAEPTGGNSCTGCFFGENDMVCPETGGCADNYTIYKEVEPEKEETVVEKEKIVEFKGEKYRVGQEDCSGCDFSRDDHGMHCPPDSCHPCSDDDSLHLIDEQPSCRIRVKFKDGTPWFLPEVKLPDSNEYVSTRKMCSDMLTWLDVFNSDEYFLDSREKAMQSLTCFKEQFNGELIEEIKWEDL